MDTSARNIDEFQSQDLERHRTQAAFERGKQEVQTFVDRLLEEISPMDDETMLLAVSNEPADTLRNSLIADLQFYFMMQHANEAMPNKTPHEKVESFWSQVWGQFTDPLSDGMPRPKGKYLCRLARILHSDDEMKNIAVTPTLAPDECVFSSKPDIERTVINADTLEVQTSYYQSLAAIVYEYEEILSPYDRELSPSHRNSVDI